MTEEAAISASAVRSFLGGSPRPDAGSALSAYEGMSLSDARDRFERELIQARLREHGGNVSRAAESLGVYASNLHSKMKKLKMTAEK